MLDKTNWTAKENRTLLEPWRQVLLAAADLVDERGLTQGQQLDRRTGQVCLMGAISIARFGVPHKHDADDTTCRAVEAVGAYLRSTGVPYNMAPPSGSAIWNNVKGRTKEEVSAALRGAASAEPTTS